MTYFMSPDSNHWRRRRRGPAQNTPRGPNPKANDSQPKWRGMISPSYDVTLRYYWTIYLVNGGGKPPTSGLGGVGTPPTAPKIFPGGGGGYLTPPPGRGFFLGRAREGGPRLC